MIIYKRELEREDAENLSNNEELIYYKSEDIAITINRVENRFIVRKVRIGDGEKLQESLLNTLDEAMEFIDQIS